MTSTGSVSSSTVSPSAALQINVSGTTVPGGALNQNSFLQLLATQLQYQNPLQPTSNTQFIAQLAQFSSLEQMTNVATGETKLQTGLATINSNTQLATAFSIMGDTATVQTGSGVTVSGIVSSVNTQSGAIMVTVGSESYPLQSIVSVTKPGL
ncbi:flagellar hook capping FlgD N-terminal domain-containing protein [Ferroacidibacillus organovorans]|uniref:Flagellar hook capping protein n=1 Tax=Ferroacidibacillus organovorans TaxID=1765683 RepID=A0A101XPA4_9BACL|nr:flagellar hook capping FlgD N-terminal domain-containing protein [Ferroacidibacillus organovorans]KUO95065.1 hypothetical protein ATW55_11350 [Ferroacidibacillus organovorans]